jgi:DNA-binding response OmpR family regulator
MDTMKRILIAEDQTDIRDLLALNLRAPAMRSPRRWTVNGESALAAHSQQPADLLVLDLMMPHMDGLDVCKALRARGSTTPILMLTAKSTELDRVLGLELGADDYLTKPFSVAELLARVKALLRRAELVRAASVSPTAPLQPMPMTNGDVEIQPAKRQVRLRGVAVEFTALEFDLLLSLCTPPGAGVFAGAAAQCRLGLYPRRL